MPIEITMPKLSDTMEEGTILRWLKHEGDHIEKGDALAEVETDKADMELEADRSGTLGEIRVKEGQAAPVGAVIALMGDADGRAPGTGAAATPSTPPAAAAKSIPPAPDAPKSNAPKAAAPKPVPTPPAPAAQAAPPQRPASPAPAAPPRTQWKPHQTDAAPPAPTGPQAESKLRAAVAKQMTAAKRDVPHFYVTCEIDMSDAARLRASLADSGAVAERITFTHLIIRAVTVTLQRHPRINASWADGGITFHEDINVGIAVAVDDGLIAPVLRGCQNLSLQEIARGATDLVEKAQAGRFGGDALTGGTFTISNMGMLDIEEFSAVIIPPQAAILAVGAIKDRPVVRNAQVGIAKTMRVTLSADHRVLNGIEAGRFLVDLKKTLENPVLLILARP